MREREETDIEREEERGRERTREGPRGFVDRPYLTGVL